jgi:hypothetical protein
VSPSPEASSFDLGPSSDPPVPAVPPRPPVPEDPPLPPVAPPPDAPPLASGRFSSIKPRSTSAIKVQLVIGTKENNAIGIQCRFRVSIIESYRSLAAQKAFNLESYPGEGNGRQAFS